MKFNIRDLVRSVIAPDFIGLIVEIRQTPDDHIYKVSWMSADGPTVSEFYEFELELVSDTGSLGYKVRD